MSIETSPHNTVIQDFIDALEALRYLRQDEWAGKTHPLGKRFTQEEIATGPYRAYRNLLTGRTQRLPQRPTVLEIADYLEASIDETNQLLMAAHYLPEEKRLNGLNMHITRQIIHDIFDSLAVPALLLTPELKVEKINGAFSRLFEVELPPTEDVSIIDLYLDESLAIAPQLSAKEKHTSPQNSYIVRTFLDNPPGVLHHQPWYQQLKAQAQRYLTPNLHRAENTADNIEFTAMDGEAYHLRCLQLSGTPGYSPVIFGCSADDAPAEMIFAQNEIPVDVYVASPDTETYWTP